jgi:hypothetical protein
MANEYPKDTFLQTTEYGLLPARDWTHEPGDTLSQPGAMDVATSNTYAFLDTATSLTPADFSAKEVALIREAATLATQGLIPTYNPKAE